MKKILGRMPLVFSNMWCVLVCLGVFGYTLCGCTTGKTPDGFNVYGVSPGMISGDPAVVDTASGIASMLPPPWDTVAATVLAGAGAYVGGRKIERKKHPAVERRKAVTV